MLAVPVVVVGLQPIPTQFAASECATSSSPLGSERGDEDVVQMAHGAPQIPTSCAGVV